MLKNYFKIAWRKIKKNKLYSFVNIIGLTAGLTSCFLIGIYLYNELSYDSFHQNADRIVRLTMQYSYGTSVESTANTGTKDGPQFKREFPEVEQYVRTMKSSKAFNNNGQLFSETVMYADEPFFSVFSFPLIEGNPNTALNSPDKIVITEAIAKKYFGNQDALGKVIKADNKFYTVSGIAKNTPSNSQMQFDMVLPFNLLSAAKSPEQWFTANYITYLLLKSPADVQPLQKQINAYMQSVSTGELKMTGGAFIKINIEHLKDVHLHSPNAGFEPNGNIVYIYILFSIALLTLFIAAVNYTNLAVAQSANRSAEISIRKILGAGKSQLFRQFLGESVLFVLIALVLSLILGYLLLPQFNLMAGKKFTSHDFFNPVVLSALIVLSIIMSVVSGSYPSLLLSNVKLAKLLKSGFSFTGNSSVKQSLIVFQFIISFFLILSTAVISKQLNYIQTKDVGYKRDNIIALPLDWQIYGAVNTLKTQFANIPGVQQVSVANSSPVEVQWGDNITSSEGGKTLVNAIPADENYLPLFGMKLLAGSNFTHADLMLLDTTKGGKNYRNTFIINESAAKALGWTPEQAIGKTINKGQDGIVKGVVQDFNFKSLHEPISPLIIFLDKFNTNNIFLKVSTNDMPGVLKTVETIWKHEVNNRPFEFHFIDDDYNAIYVNEQRTAAIFKTFSVLAILLACLGLFALTAYAVVNRTKEIGIRKVLGASVSSIMLMLSKSFLKLVLIAILIASPIAWLVMNKWLQDFAFRIQIPWYLFIIAGLSTILIAFVTVSLQSGKAALSNPVKALRND